MLVAIVTVNPTRSYPDRPHSGIPSRFVHRNGSLSLRSEAVSRRITLIEKYNIKSSLPQIVRDKKAIRID